MDRFETEYTIAADHPALPGHFPGNPVVPGVVILDHVLQALHAWQGDAVPARIQDTKFVSPLLPGQAMQITLTQKDEQAAAFECRVAERRVAQGRIRLQRNGA